MIKSTLNSEKRGRAWTQNRLWLEMNWGWFGLFIIKRITMTWLRYLYLLGPRLKYRLNIHWDHSLLSSVPEIDHYWAFEGSSYGRLLSHIRKYTTNQGIPEKIKLRDSQPNRGLSVLLFLRSVFPLFGVEPALSKSEIQEVRNFMAGA